MTRKLQEDAFDKHILSPAGEADFKRNFTLARAQVDEHTFQEAWEEGMAMTLEQAVAYALEENDESNNARQGERRG